MTNKNQFKASFKKEWLEIVRTKKLVAYFLLSFGFLVFNFIFKIVLPAGIFNDGSVQGANLYTFQASFNNFLLGLNLIVVLFLNRNVVTRELSEKKLALPLSLGLKASINITAKMILQVLVPSLIAALASIANGLFGLAFLPNVVVVLSTTLTVAVSLNSILMAALCVFISIALFMMLLLSFQALIRNANIALIMTLVILLLCDNFTVTAGGMTSFTPVAFYSFGMHLATTSTTSQIVLSTLVTSSIVFLITIAGALVYTDRNDFAI